VIQEKVVKRGYFCFFLVLYAFITNPDYSSLHLDKLNFLSCGRASPSKPQQPTWGQAVIQENHVLPSFPHYLRSVPQHLVLKICPRPPAGHTDAKFSDVINALQRNSAPTKTYLFSQENTINKNSSS
jgi:hypothetical protein